MQIHEIMAMGAQQLRKELETRGLPLVGTIHDMRAALIARALSGPEVKSGAAVEPPTTTAEPTTAEAQPQPLEEAKPEAPEQPVDEVKPEVSTTTALVDAVVTKDFMQPVRVILPAVVQGAETSVPFNVVATGSEAPAGANRAPDGVAKNESAVQSDAGVEILNKLHPEFVKLGITPLLQGRIIQTLASGGTVFQVGRLARFFDTPLSENSRRDHKARYGKELQFFWNDKLTQAS